MDLQPCRMGSADITRDTSGNGNGFTLGNGHEGARLIDELAVWLQGFMHKLS